VDAVVMERNGNPRGFGFVTFKEKSALESVLAEGVMIDGREVDIKRAVPEEEMAVASSKVFVGGLPQTVDKQALQEHFEQFGEVRDAVVMVDRTTGRSRGFGFVRFNSPDAVERVIASPQELGGQPVDVKRAEPADTLPPAQPARAKDDAKGRRRRRGKRGADDDLPSGVDSAAAADAAFGFDPQTAAAAAAQLNLAMSFLSLTQQAMLGTQAGFPPSFPLSPNLTQAASLFAATATAQANAAMTAPAPNGAAEPTAHPDLSTIKFEKQTAPVPLGDLSNVINGARGTSEKARWGPPLPLAKMAGESTLGHSGIW